MKITPPKVAMTGGRPLRVNLQTRYAPDEDQLVRDVDDLRVMVTDLLLPAKFQARPNTFCRNKINEYLASGRYANPVINQALKNALKWPQPYAWLERTFRQAMAAVQAAEAEQGTQS